MLLHEHPEFKQAILAAGAYFQRPGLRAAIIEKDYYVTEVLRRIYYFKGDKVIFKGGTSLSKGWNLIERFSEDLDLFLNPRAFVPPLGKNALDREMKEIKNIVSAWGGLRHLPLESQTFGGVGRNDRFSYPQLFWGIGDVTNRVLLELGSASGVQPTQVVTLESYLSRFMREEGYSLGCEDEKGFDATLLHFRRTFVEKMFALHSKVEKFKEDKNPIGKYSRHYYDLYQLSFTPDVLSMLTSPEYEEIRKDYEEISLKHFSKDYRPPEKLHFSESSAFFPSEELSQELEKSYEKECKILCYGRYPTWKDLLERFSELKPFL